MTTTTKTTRRVILDEIDTLDIECARLERRISRKENRIAQLNQMLIDDDNARTIAAGDFVASIVSGITNDLSASTMTNHTTTTKQTFGA